MAPKQKDSAYELNVTKDSTRMLVMDVSTGGDSGHRDLVEKEVDIFVEEFLGGQYLKSILRKPILRAFGGQQKSCKDGLAMLLDGKKTIAALKRCHDIYNSPARDEHSWTPKLIDHLENGVDFSEAEVENDDDAVHLKWAAGVHAEESNKYTPTSIRTMIKIANNEIKRTAGGDLDEARKALETFYGKKKRMFVYRMMLFSQTICESWAFFRELEHPQQVDQREQVFRWRKEQTPLGGWWPEGASERRFGSTAKCG